MEADGSVSLEGVRGSGEADESEPEEEETDSSDGVRRSRRREGGVWSCMAGAAGGAGLR